MPLIYNPRGTKVAVQVCGNWFEFGPDQIKLIHRPEIAHLIVTDKSYEGLVDVPDICVEAPNSEEAKKAKLEAKRKGINNRVKHLERVKTNLLVSLQRDLDIAGIKSDVLLYASEGEREALKELKTYMDTENTERAAELEELKKLREAVSGNNAVKPDTSKTDKRS